MLSRHSFHLLTSLCLCVFGGGCHEDTTMANDTEGGIEMSEGGAQVFAGAGEPINEDDQGALEERDSSPLGGEASLDLGPSTLDMEQTEVEGGQRRLGDMDISGPDMLPNLMPDQGLEVTLDMTLDAEPPSVVTPFVAAYWSATHNSYEGEERGSILEQLSSGVRALELDLHDNNFRDAGYRIGHLQYGDAVARGGENPDSDQLEPWLDVIQSWSQGHPGHAPIILTLDLKDNLMDNKSYDEGNLAHLNDVLSAHLERLWRPSDGLDDIDSARDHTLCVLSGDGGTRRGYLRDLGSSPTITINSGGEVLEVHDSGSGSLWYWSGVVSSAEGVRWRRHGEYDSGQRPSALLNLAGQVVEVHQSESRDRLWASTGTLSAQGELSLTSASSFSDGTWPSLRWRDPSRGLFTLRYSRGGVVYERDGSADFASSSISWGNERSTPEGALIFSRREVIHQGRTYRVDESGAPAAFPPSTLWLTVTGGGALHESPVRYPQLCFVEWQRDEHSDPLLGAQLFGALPGGDYANLPERVRERYLIRGWQFNGRDSAAPAPQIPSTDHPYEERYQGFMESLGALE